MNFGEILDAVCSDGIDGSRRASAKEWVRFRHSWVWGAANWTFKQSTATITFTANQQIAAAPADVHAVFAVFDATGCPLEAIKDLRRFFTLYNTLGGTPGGSPEAYTVVDGDVYVGPQGDGSDGMIVYQRTKPDLVDDTDPTGLPDSFDLCLVHGAKAEGFKFTNAPALAATFDADFTAAVNALQNDWLQAILETGGSSGAFRPAPAWPAYGR